MSKLIWKPGNLIAPVPAAMVSCGTMEKPNIITIAWTGNVSSSPAKVSISVRPERYSYGLIKESGEFVLNLTTAALARATDFCGVRSGREVDKVAACGLTLEEPEVISVPAIRELPLTLECRVIYRQQQDLGAITPENLKKFYPQEVDSSFHGRNRDLHTAFYGQVLAAYLVEQD